jgi:hypothetical protein
MFIFKTRNGMKFAVSAAALTVALLGSSAAWADNWATGTAGKITSGANTTVGIGTTTIGTGIKLQVNGNVRASGFIEATGGLRVKAWAMEVPDYVFDESKYTPQSLVEVEKFVKENHHLPEIPSAKELKDKGMDLVQMNLLLLKKVEELTLHAIDQDKKIKELAAVCE